MSISFRNGVSFQLGFSRPLFSIRRRSPIENCLSFADEVLANDSLLRNLEPLWLLIALIAITVLHYANISGDHFARHIVPTLHKGPMASAVFGRRCPHTPFRLGQMRI